MKVDYSIFLNCEKNWWLLQLLGKQLIRYTGNDKLTNSRLERGNMSYVARQTSGVNYFRVGTAFG